MIERDQAPPDLASPDERSQLAGWVFELFGAFAAWRSTRGKTEFDRFLNLAHGPVRRSVVRYLSARPTADRDLVDDLVQETFLKLCAGDGSALARMENATPLGLLVYLRVVAHNVASDWFRGRAADKRGGSSGHVSLDDAPPGAFASGENQADRVLLMEKIRRCLHERAAKVRDRAIFWLYFRQGLSAKAISAVSAVGLAQKGVESTILRLVKAIQDCLKGKPTPKSSKLLES